MNYADRFLEESASHHSYREILIARAQAEQPGEGYREQKSPFMLC